jgi:hypothetical protein
MEALEHRQEAIRHLRLLREAHTLSAFGPSLTLNHATMATGAAMLAAAISPRISPRDHSSPRGSKPDAKPAASPRDPSAVPGVPVTASKGRRASSAEGAVPGAAKTLPPGFGAFRAEVEASLASEAAVGGQTLGARPSPRGRQRAGVAGAAVRIRPRRRIPGARRANNRRFAFERRLTHDKLHHMCSSVL